MAGVAPRVTHAPDTLINRDNRPAIERFCRRLRGKTFVSGRLRDNAEARREQKNRRVTGRKFALIRAISGEGTGPRAIAKIAHERFALCGLRMARIDYEPE